MHLDPRMALLGLAYFAGLTGCDREPVRDSVRRVPSQASITLCGTPVVMPTVARNLPPPALRAGLGTAQMQVTTRSAEAQAFFNQGLNLLHGFAEFEAFRAFLRATQLDPGCAMAWWGMVMCLPGNPPEHPEEREEALRRALALRHAVTPREQSHINALEVLVNKGTTSFARAMLDHWRRFPGDVDAAVLAAYHLKDDYTSTGRHRVGQAQAIQVIEAVLERQPDHTGALHYAIHIFELGPELERAVPLAGRVARLAPQSAHLVHMPGHVAFFRGDYESARDHFLAADRVETEYLATDNVPTTENKNHAHNLHFLALACLEAGRMNEALQAAARLKNLPQRAGRSRSEAGVIAGYEGRSLAGRLLMRAGQWQRAAQVLGTEIGEAPDGLPRFCLEALRHFALAMQAAEDGMRHDLHQACGDFDQAHAGMKTALQNSGGFEAHYARRHDAMLDLLGKMLSAERSGSTAGARIFLEGAREAEGGSWRLDPPLLPMSLHEITAAWHLRRGDADQARASFEEALKQRPNNGFVWLGIARAEKLAGNIDAARIAAKKAVASWPHGDSDLPALTAARHLTR